jgi:hypothetical protein
MFDLFVGFNYQLLDIALWDYTTFQGPFRMFCLTRLPQGHTNLVQIQQVDINFILQDEIPKFTQPFVDNTPIKGPETFYLLPDRSYKTIPKNQGIQ